MITSTSTAETRYFIYEVSGLNQYKQPANANYTLRPNDNVFIQVPYNRMNEKMRSITRMGGTIVSIQPLNENLPQGE
jgi:protein involved in polysaccharide export with SLBB domain